MYPNNIDRETMNPKDLQGIFCQPYNASVWQELMIALFNPGEVRLKQSRLESNTNDEIEGHELGRIHTPDLYEIGLFAFEIKNKHKIPFNRVGLRSLVHGYTKHNVDAAIVVYYNDEHWRVSFICDIPREGKKTESKRYTYVFGNKHESYRTAASMLGKLLDINKPGFEDIKAAFSVEALSKEFFDGYIDQYKKFSTYIGDADKRNRDFVKKMLGRLVFLQFLQKKGWMGVPAHRTDWQGGDVHYLQNLVAREAGNDHLLQEVFKKLFFETLNCKRAGDIAHPRLGDNIKIPYLNGGLFDPDENDRRGENFPYNFFKELVVFFLKYNFTIDENDPNDAEVGIDPEMLGHIFEYMLEDNKVKGAFYTPKEIVQYMCRQSLIEYLQSKLGKHKDIEDFINNHETGHRSNAKSFIAQHGQRIEKLLDEVKICDPAIGSGAFPMGILNEIFQAKIALNMLQDHAEVKKNIIQNSIYGVDIEQGAVDIARLRFWLSLVVDEEVPQPLPNLDYKIMCGNSLLSRYALDIRFDDVFKEYNKGKKDSEKMTLKKYQELVDNYTHTSDREQKDIFRETINAVKQVFRTELGKKERVEIWNLEYKISYDESCALMVERTEKEKKELNKKKSRLEKLKKERAAIDNNILYKDAFEWRFEFPQLLNDEGEFLGFDIVIANPPYISTKGVADDSKKALMAQYGFADDLYYHFIARGFELLVTDGIVTMITPDTYFTTLTKKNLRKLLLQNTMCSLVHLGHDVFDAAMVSTAIFISRKSSFGNTNLVVVDARGKKRLTEASHFDFSQNEYENSINGSFFVPNKANLKLHKLLSSVHSELIDNWWDKIETAREINRNETELNKYRNLLNPGDWTLVGLVTEGGQGLATANNGKFVGVRQGTKEAERIKHTRIAKLAEVNKKCKTDYIMPDTEKEIWTLFENIKTKHGRDVFGQGYLYKIVASDLMVNVDKLSAAQRKDGISDKATFVPYDKGDKDGNRWYLETPYRIDWSCENVYFLKNNSGKKGEGMPVVRNPQFYFREGFCWNNNLNESYEAIKCKLKQRGIPDVASMSLYSICSKTPDYYIVTMINSAICGMVYRRFLNATVNVQINDIKALPIPVPNTEQLAECKRYFDAAVKIQQDFFSGSITSATRDTSLATIQTQIDEMVYKLYRLTDEEITLIGK